jgi:hypothetical protein
MGQEQNTSEYLIDEARDIKLDGKCRVYRRESPSSPLKLVGETAPDYLGAVAIIRLDDGSSIRLSPLSVSEFKDDLVKADFKISPLKRRPYVQWLDLQNAYNEVFLTPFHQVITPRKIRPIKNPDDVLSSAIKEHILRTPGECEAKMSAVYSL